MPQIITLDGHADSRGSLTVVDGHATIDVRRVYWIYGVDQPTIVRGGHRHRLNRQLLVCVSGSCRISGQTPEEDFDFVLDNPGHGLVLEPEDWHVMTDFSRDAVLLVMASKTYDRDDYVDSPYRPWSGAE